MSRFLHQSIRETGETEMREINGQTLEDLLDNLQGFIENELKEFRLPVKRDGTWKHEPVCRSVEVSQMVMPEPDEDHERVPYILLQLLNGKDERNKYGQMECVVSVRVIVTLFNRDKREGRMQLLYIIQRLRKAFLLAGVIGGCFELRWPLEYLIYPDDAESYHLGEMATSWSAPGMERDIPWLSEGRM